MFQAVFTFSFTLCSPSLFSSLLLLSCSAFCCLFVNANIFKQLFFYCKKMPYSLNCGDLWHTVCYACSAECPGGILLQQRRESHYSVHTVFCTHMPNQSTYLWSALVSLMVWSNHIRKTSLVAIPVQLGNPLLKNSFLKSLCCFKGVEKETPMSLPDRDMSLGLPYKTFIKVGNIAEFCN